MKITIVVFMLILFLSVLYNLVEPQCYEDSNISMYHNRSTVYYQEGTRGRPQCIGNYSVICETHIDDKPSKGIVCSKKDSTATDGYWMTGDGTILNCDGSTTNGDIKVKCIQGNGYVTAYTGSEYDVPPVNLTCCIEGLCATFRLLRYPDFEDFFKDQSDDAQLETCIIVPPSDITAVPQQYLVQMNTSVIPFSRLSSLINCTDGDGITCGQSYYTLIDLNEERYQMTVPVTWSTDSTTNTDHYYSCHVRFGGLTQNDNNGGMMIPSKDKNVSIEASSAPSSVSYEVVNATAINVSWSISGDVNGFIINITSDGLDTVTIQLTDDSLREYVINRLILYRNYTVEVRGYHELLGPAETTTVRLEAEISTINGSLLSVSDDLSTQVIQVNCTTLRVTPDQVTWMIDSVLITPDSSYEPVNSSVLLDSTYQTYRHCVTLTGSFTDGTTISCNANVSGESISKGYTLRAPSSPPTGLSATILSSTSLSISWTPLSDGNGYIIQYTGGQPVMVNGEDSSNSVLEGLTQGTTYQIDIYSYSDLPSTTSADISILLDVPLLTSFDVQPHSLLQTAVQLTWSLSDSSIIDSFTLSVTRVCDNVQIPISPIGGSLMSFHFPGISSGFEYFFVLTPVNILGEGISRNGTITLEETIPPSVAPLFQSPVTINSTAVRLTWDEVHCPHSNGIITGYRVMYHSNEVQQSATINITDDTTSTVITGLMEFQLYYFSVSAINSIGAGPYSEQKKAYTINLMVSDISVTTSTSFAQLSWQPLPSVTNVSYEYEVAYGVIDSAECTGNSVSLPNEYTVYSPRTSNSTIDVLGLMSGTCYVFGVRAYANISDSTSNGEFSVINGSTVSDVFESPSVVNSTLSSVVLSWSTLPVVSIDEYFYEVGYDDECTDGLTTLPQHYTSYINTTNGRIEVTGLEDDTCYVFGVRVYSTRTGQHGEWNVQQIHTDKVVTTSVSSPAVSVYSTSVAAESPTENGSFSGAAVTGTIVGVSIVLVLLLVCIIIVLIVGMRRRSSPASSKKAKQLERKDSTIVNNPMKAPLPRYVRTMPAKTDDQSLNSHIEDYSMDSLRDYTKINPATKDSEHLYSNVGNVLLNNVSGHENQHYEVVSDMFDPKAAKANQQQPEERETHLSSSHYVADPVHATTEDHLYSNINEVRLSEELHQSTDELAVFDPMIPEIYPIPVEEFGQFVLANHRELNKGFRDQFKDLYTGDEKQCEIGQRKEFKLLNRFKNIIAYDDNRIVLRPLASGSDGSRQDESVNDYINAAYVDGYSEPMKFIATQGPLTKTVNDFWHMMWQEKVQLVVMLSKLVEETKTKCTQYWPEEVNGTETYGQFTVTLMEEKNMLNYVQRTLKLQCIVSPGDVLIVKHYQYITWPDHGVPESVSPLMSLRQQVMSLWSPDKEPILVHCSAGVGRTGTFIAVDLLAEQVDNEKKVDIAGIVTRLREQRMKMVQTDAQYAFIHDAVLEAIVIGPTEIPSNQFTEMVNSWKEESVTNGTTKLQEQFEGLDNVTSNIDDVINQTAEKFSDRNRSMKYLPPENWRVHLRGETPDYIHATFINGYFEKRRFIIAESPMANTVRNFWKMVMDYQVSAIVMCCEMEENQMEVCSPYWDESSPAVYGEFFIQVVRITSKIPGVIHREIKLSSDKNEGSVTIDHFQFTNWDSRGICATPQSILDVIENIKKIQRKPNSFQGPIVTHCSDTIGRSGVFSVISNTIEQCNAETVVDIFQTTKAVRAHKPMAVNTLEQYQFIHDVIVRYLEVNNTYANFT